MLVLPNKPNLIQHKSEPSEPRDPKIGMYHGSVQQAKAVADAYGKYAAELEKYQKELEEVRKHNNEVSNKNYKIWQEWFDNLPRTPLMDKMMEMVRDRYDHGEKESAYIYLGELIDLVNFANK